MHARTTRQRPQKSKNKTKQKKITVFTGALSALSPKAKPAEKDQFNEKPTRVIPKLALLPVYRFAMQIDPELKLHKLLRQMAPYFLIQISRLGRHVQ